MRSVLLTWIAFPTAGRGDIVGTGFIVGGAPSGHAIALTAKHVIADGVVHVQTPNRRHATSALPEFLPPASPKVNPEAIRAVWMGGASADLMLVEHVFYAQSLDIAVTLVRPQDHVDTIRLSPLAIDTSMPEVGEQVILYSCSGLEFEGGKIGKGDVGAIGRAVVARTGHVTEVFLDGHRQYRWPCFTTTIPAEPGMSGGIVCRSRADDRIAVCGVVSADWSTDEARKDFRYAGESLIAAVWPSLGLEVPWLVGEAFETRLLLDVVREGAIVDLGDGVDRFTIIPRGDGHSVHRRA
ncbi:MAG: trypsin-like peptidase domain-containing protein [Hyphomonadaceae bacterium]